MSIPVWALLGFAGWTLLILFATVGVYRWSRILTGRATVREWRADEEQGANWYRRAMRAHMNCVENLPVFAAIVVAIMAAGLQSAFLDILALAILGARIVHSLWHILLEQTEVVASIRFALYFLQILAMLAMGIYVAVHA
ncbi:MAG: MAPEG family protein [Thiohalorhabdus sp.]|uniref:MAPEG family protein n=1 Tax=Thiohalorhabdus sp. TaxID=3094134 RepID=UPI00397EAECC